jgi:putative membrane protein
MMYYGPGMSGWGMTFMIIGNLVLWGLLIFGAVLVARYVWPGQTASSSSSSPPELSPQQIAAQRFARGEINEQEYQHLLQVLSGGSAEVPK